MAKISISVSFNDCKQGLERKVGCQEPILTASSPGYWDQIHNIFIVIVDQPKL